MAASNKQTKQRLTLDAAMRTMMAWVPMTALGAVLVRLLALFWAPTLARQLAPCSTVGWALHWAPALAAGWDTLSRKHRRGQVQWH